MAKDRIHYAVRNALEKDGWEITADPYRIKLEETKMEVDLEAEKVIAAKRGKEKILIEVKSFTKTSILHSFYEAYGQYDFYRDAIEDFNLNRPLYLATSTIAYKRILNVPFLVRRIEQHQIKFIIIDIVKEKIIAWKN